MEHRLKRTSWARAALALGLTALLALPLAGEAAGHPVRRFWEFDEDVRTHDWFQHTVLVKRHHRWHKRHPDAKGKDHREFHHHGLIHRHRLRHKYRVVGRQAGEASWFGGSVGACGVALSGLYAAHPSWPCGAKVSVRRGNRYVVVRILDRGPFGGGRVVDLSRAAFDAIGDPGSGTMDVKLYRLGKRH